MQLAPLQDLQKRLKKKTPRANEVFSSCDIFFHAGENPIAAHSSSFDPLRTAFQNLQRRWTDLLGRSDQRLAELDALHADWDAFNADYDRLQEWLREQSLILKGMDVQASRVSYESLEGIETDLEAMRLRQEAKLPELDALNDVYCELAREYRLDSSDDLKNKFIHANNDWEDLSHELQAALKRIRHSRQLYVNFRALREKEMTFLRQADARLTELEFSSDVDWREKIEGLRGLRRELGAREQQLEQVSEAGAHLVQRSELKDAEHIEALTKEFGDLQTDVSDRLERLLDSIRPPAESSSEAESSAPPPQTDDLPPISVTTSIQVDTLKYEREASTQADTLQLGSSAPDSGVSMHTPVDVERGATPLSSSQSPLQRMPAAAPVEEAAEVDEYLSRLSEEASSMEDNYDQLVADLERHLGEFHSNGDLMEDALLKSVATSEQDMVSVRAQMKLRTHIAINVC